MTITAAAWATPAAGGRDGRSTTTRCDTHKVPSQALGVLEAAHGAPSLVRTRALLGRMGIVEVHALLQLLVAAPTRWVAHELLPAPPADKAPSETDELQQHCVVKTESLLAPACLRHPAYVSKLRAFKLWSLNAGELLLQPQP